MPDILAPLLAAALSQPLCISDNVFEEAHENLFYLGLAEAELACSRCQPLSSGCGRW